ncbi:NADPH-dependent FMN reductase [Hydrogenispora ethanolica]|uniref:NADPH-dependent FMN reductase n=1 Tax=Hydrogenispora ethanolica TaxID=1082276 RepID=A0A4R1S9G8_HYDET|nr:flavodoxin family protein [Hydrogenispora ethanolica]TCL75162.1 NADPH-dependent FMN reductase [Hydrogenispora ethanolica]
MSRKVIAVNGSPRKTWNTATLVRKALDGAAAQGAETELVHLYDLNFKGCTSCFACKRRDGKSYGQCAMRDELTPVLARIAAADALVIGSPIYFGAVTGEIRSFMERLLFQYLVYAIPPRTLFPKTLPVGFIYTMNVDDERLRSFKLDEQLRVTENAFQRAFGEVTTLYATDTLQFDDYAQYVNSMFDPEHKAKRRAEQFPKDCEAACAMGARLAGAGVAGPQ